MDSREYGFITRHGPKLCIVRAYQFYIVSIKTLVFLFPVKYPYKTFCNIVPFSFKYARVTIYLDTFKRPVRNAGIKYKALKGDKMHIPTQTLYETISLVLVQFVVIRK